jgi:hypothetical protein
LCYRLFDAFSFLFLKSNLGQYLLDYLVKRVGMSHYVQNILCKHFALLTKIGWLERDQSDNLPFQTPIKTILTLAKASFKIYLYLTLIYRTFRIQLRAAFSL